MKRLLLAVLASTAAGAALAASEIIEDAKNACIAGEQIDGYIGVIDNGRADAALTREIRSINQQRKAAYERLAERNGVTIEDTAKLTAQKLINQAPSGHCVQIEDGSWARKP